MTAIDQRLHNLPASQARKFERLLAQLLDLFNPTDATDDDKPVQRYTLPSRGLQVRHGLDLTKLAYFDEDGLES